MTREQETVISLLRIALSGKVEDLSADVDWAKVIDASMDQGVLGVCFPAIERLPMSQRPDLDSLMDWYGLVDYEETQSKRMDKACTKVARVFKMSGFDCVILKGQGIARLYASYHLGKLLRTPGDIDCWLFADRDVICNYLRENVPGYTDEHEGALHTEFKLRDITVEVHFTATYLITPKYSKRLKRWIDEQKDVLIKSNRETDSFPVPTIEFNLVYLVLHMYRHYLFEGIGLRHIIDYCLVLKLASDEQKRTAMETLKWLGADRFTAALLWVLTDWLRLIEADEVLLTPDVKRGKMLMDAILTGGNFGKADKKNSAEYREWGVKRLWRFVSRNAELFFAYPSEIGWHVVKRVSPLRLITDNILKHREMVGD